MNNVHAVQTIKPPLPLVEFSPQADYHLVCLYFFFSRWVSVISQQNRKLQHHLMSGLTFYYASTKRKRNLICRKKSGRYAQI
jgi:hypothetical protein